MNCRDLAPATISSITNMIMTVLSIPALDAFCGSTKGEDTSTPSCEGLRDVVLA